MKHVLLEPTSLIAVEVPEDADGFMLMTNAGNMDTWAGAHRSSYDLYANGIYNTPLKVLCLKEKHDIVGTVTPDSISFDVEPHVGNNGLGCYENYKGIYDNRYTYLTAADSFRSLLKQHGMDGKKVLIMKNA